MAIFSPVQQEVNPMDPIIPQGQGGAPVAEGLASLSSLFLSAPTQQREATQNELFGERVREYGERLGNPNWSLGDARMGEIQGFVKAYPEFATEAISVAKSSLNEEYAAAENALTTTQSVQKANDEAWLTSPEGVYANAKAQEFANEEEGAAFLSNKKAEWQALRAENAAIKMEVETQGAYDTLSARAWNINVPSAKTEADIFARGLEQLSLAIAADPTATFNLDDTGITQLIPELRGTVVNQRNIISVANIARGALENRFRNDISAKTGIDANALGVAPEGWNKSVFNTFDTTVTWTANEVDPATIQKRLEGEAFTSMANAGVPVQYLSTFAKLSGANPALSAQLMASLSGPVGKFGEELMAGRLEEANRVLQEASKKDLIDARYAFTELVAVMSGTSPLARTYEEVTQDQKDVEISVALTGAFKSHRELQRTEGPTRWNRAAWRQNFEVPAEAIVRRSATDTNFATETSSFMSSDIMLDLGNLRDAAAPNGVNISISENGQVVISATDQAAPLQGATVGVARRPITPGDKLRTFTEENKAIIDDINYKMTVLGRLGDVGQSTMDILRAEVPSAETTTRAGGAGSGSTSTANPITYALPEAIAADTEFLDKVVSVSSELGFDPNDLLRVIDFETAGSFSPKAQPIRKDGTKISSATGLIQFLEKTANGLGTTTAELAGMTAVEQLDFVKDYFEPFKGRIKNFGDIYMAVHWPAGVGKDDSYVMYKAGSDSYKANKGLDTNGDGTVTRGETLARLFSATGKGGNPTAGTPANENTVAAAAGPAVQRAVAPSGGSPSSGITMPSGGAPAAPVTTGEVVVADATLPEAIPAETPTGTQGASELSPAISVDQDVQAFIQEIAGDPDKSYASEAEFLAAQERGELEAGDTVVVNEEVYVVRKNGSVRRLGNASAGAGNDTLGGGAGNDTLNDSVEWSASSGEPFIPREGDTIQATEPTLQEKGFDSVFSFLTSLGVDKGAARSYTSRLVGTKSRVGLADLTPVGSAFMVEEGVKTVAKGIESGDPATIAQGAAEAGLGAISAIPAVSLVGKGLSKVLKAAPTNNIRTVVRTDNVFRGEGAYKTSLDKPTKPYAVRLTGESQVEDMIRSGLVRSKEGGYQGKNIVYYGEMDDVKPTSIFTKPKPNDKQKNYTIVADSTKIAGSASPATLDDLLHVWTIKDGELVDVLPELRLLNNMVQ